MDPELRQEIISAFTVLQDALDTWSCVAIIHQPDSAHAAMKNASDILEAILDLK
jgi:hypothetical protein